MNNWKLSTMEENAKSSYCTFKNCVYLLWTYISRQRQQVASEEGYTLVSGLLSLLLWLQCTESFPLAQVPNQWTLHSLISFEFFEDSAFEHTCHLDILAFLTLAPISGGSSPPFMEAPSLPTADICCFSFVASLRSLSPISLPLCLSFSFVLSSPDPCLSSNII